MRTQPARFERGAGYSHTRRRAVRERIMFSKLRRWMKWTGAWDYYRAHGMTLTGVNHPRRNNPLCMTVFP